MRNPDAWWLTYNTVFVAAIAVAFLISATLGLRRGIRRDAWLTLLTTVLVGGVIGSKLIDFDLGPMGPGEKTILGGLAGGLAAAILASRALGIRTVFTLDRLVPGLLVAIGIGRIGCHVAGCCFGTPTEAAWGVVYGQGTAVWNAQLAAGLIPESATSSLAVHPVPLYEALGCLFLLGFLLRRGIGEERPGHRILTTAVGYAVLRLLVEFWRGGRDTFGALNTVQWVLIGVLAGLLALRVVLRSRPCQARLLIRTGLPAARAHVLLAVCAISVVLLSNWFDPLERLVLVSSTLLACAFAARPTAGGVSLAAVAPGLALVLAQASESSDRYPRGHFAIGGGAVRGVYDVFLGTTGGTDCAGAGTPLKEYHAEREYLAGGVSVAYRREEGPHSGGTAKMHFFTGRDQVRSVLEDGLPASLDPSLGPGPSDFEVSGGAFSVRLDDHYVGIEGGVAIGRLTTGEAPVDLRLIGSIRAGSLSSGFVELRTRDLEPWSPPEGWVAAGLGKGTFGSQFRIGIGFDGAVMGSVRLVPASAGWELDGIIGRARSRKLNSGSPYLGIGLKKRVSRF